MGKGSGGGGSIGDSSSAPGFVKGGAGGYVKGGDSLAVSTGVRELSPLKKNIVATSACKEASHVRSSEKPKTRYRPKGLTNVGNSCYANSVLQCLLSTALTQALMDPEAISVFRQYSFNIQILRQGSGSVDEAEQKTDSSACRKKKQDAEQLKEDLDLQDKCVWLTRELKTITAQYVSVTSQHDLPEPSLSDSFSSWFISPKSPEVNPQSITRYPHRISPCLRPYQQEDAHEFLRALLETLAMNGRNKELSSLFDGLLESSITCGSCGRPSLTRDRYMDLSLDIADDHIETLSDALEHFTRTETLSGDNKVFCAKCDKKCCADKGLRLATAPSILVCHLKRFAFNADGGLARLSKKVSFPTHLEITNYMSNLNQSRPPAYELVAVLVHQGQSCQYGHYIAFVKSEGEWFCCNDKEVEKVPVEKVMRQQAYILMYEVADMRENHGFPSPSGSPVSADANVSNEAEDPSLLNDWLCALNDDVTQNICSILSGSNYHPVPRSNSTRPGLFCFPPGHQSHDAVPVTPPRRARDDEEVDRRRKIDVEYTSDSSPSGDERRRPSFRKSNSAVNLQRLEQSTATTNATSPSTTSPSPSLAKPSRHRCFSGSDGVDLMSNRPPLPKARTRSRQKSLDRDARRRPPRQPPKRRNTVSQ